MSENVAGMEKARKTCPFLFNGLFPWG